VDVSGVVTFAAVSQVDGINMSDDEPLTVECGPHGRRIAAVVCRHMIEVEGKAVGFVENSSNPGDLQA
jgi:hypothetical protein